MPNNQHIVYKYFTQYPSLERVCECAHLSAHSHTRFTKLLPTVISIRTKMNRVIFVSSTKVYRRKLYTINNYICGFLKNPPFKLDMFRICHTILSRFSTHRGNYAKLTQIRSDNKTIFLRKDLCLQVPEYFCY